MTVLTFFDWIAALLKESAHISDEILEDIVITALQPVYYPQLAVFKAIQAHSQAGGHADLGFREAHKYYMA